MRPALSSLAPARARRPRPNRRGRSSARAGLGLPLPPYGLGRSWLSASAIRADRVRSRVPHSAHVPCPQARLAAGPARSAEKAVAAPAAARARGAADGQCSDPRSRGWAWSLIVSQVKLTVCSCMGDRPPPHNPARWPRWARPAAARRSGGGSATRTRCWQGWRSIPVMRLTHLGHPP